MSALEEEGRRLRERAEQQQRERVDEWVKASSESSAQIMRLYKESPPTPDERAAWKDEARKREYRPDSAEEQSDSRAAEAKRVAWNAECVRGWIRGVMLGVLVALVTMLRQGAQLFRDRCPTLRPMLRKRKDDEEESEYGDVSGAFARAMAPAERRTWKGFAQWLVDRGEGGACENCAIVGSCSLICVCFGCGDDADAGADIC